MTGKSKWYLLYLSQYYLPSGSKELIPIRTDSSGPGVILISAAKAVKSFSLVPMRALNWGSSVAHYMPGQLRTGQTKDLLWGQKREEYFFDSLFLKKEHMELYDRKKLKKKKITNTQHSIIFWLNFARNLNQNWNTECHQWKNYFNFYQWIFMI